MTKKGIIGDVAHELGELAKATVVEGKKQVVEGMKEAAGSVFNLTVNTSETQKSGEANLKSLAKEDNAKRGAEIAAIKRVLREEEKAQALVASERKQGQGPEIKETKQSLPPAHLPGGPKPKGLFGLVSKKSGGQPLLPKPASMEKKEGK